MSVSDSLKNIEKQLEDEVKNSPGVIEALPMRESEGLEIARYIERLRRRSAEILDACGG